MTVLFLIVVAFCVSAFTAMVGLTAPVGKGGQQAGLTVLAIVTWVAILSVPTGLGWATPETPLPWAPLVMAIVTITTAALIASPLGRRLALGVPLWALVGFQGMRLPLEIVLHEWSAGPLVPVQMTWDGQNLDVIAGITCLALAPVAGRSRLAAWVSQVVGVGLLMNVLRVVVLSIPTPLMRFEEPLLLPFSLPHLWIAPVCVGGALVVHGLTVRRLLTGPGVAAASPSV